MFKKISLWLAALLLATVVAWGATRALAADSPPTDRPGPRCAPGERHVVQVVAVEEGQLRVRLLDGHTQRLMVNDETPIREKGNPEAALSAVEAGRWVMACWGPNSGDPPAVKQLVLLPSNFDPERALIRLGRMARRFHREGRAARHRAGRGFPHFAGEVTAVGSQTFTLRTRHGQTVEVQVSQCTYFHSRDGSLQSLDDLAEGMKVLVIPKPGTDKSAPEALAVLGGKGPRPGEGSGKPSP